MTDLLHTIPDFPTQTYTHLLPSLEKHLITTTDLLTLDALEIAKRAQVPVLDVRRLTNHVVEIIRGGLGLVAVGGRDANKAEKKNEDGEGGDRREKKLGRKWRSISTLDDSIDAALGGGIPTGYITEFTGESGTGKTQFLLTLLLSAQLPPPHGLSRPTLYISTEHPLPTSRLTQILASHPALLSTHPSQPPPSLSRILTLQTPDLESQDHILTYQLPVALARHKIGLCIIDSVAANYRAEQQQRPEGGGGGGSHVPNSPYALAHRSTQLVRLGTLLRSLARTHDCAIVVSNQVSDRFPPPPPTLKSSSHHHLLPSSSSNNNNNNNNNNNSSTPLLLSLDHQQRFFTGWGAHPSSSPSASSSNLKTPSLGPVWTNQIACRIALTKEVEYGRIAPPPTPHNQALIETAEAEPIASTMTSTTRRWMKVVFAPWVKGTSEGAEEEDKGIQYEIWAGGVRALGNGNT